MIPVRLGRLQSFPVLYGIATNPLSKMRDLHAAKGRYVILEYPQSRRSRPQILACIADSGLYRAVVSNSDHWRTVNVGLRLLKNHVTSRLNFTFPRLRGARHAHYRRLLTPPLSKTAVTGMSPEMAAIAKRRVETWPRNQLVDFVPLAGDLMQDFAIALLFGNDHARALPIARMIDDCAPAAWPFPGPALFKYLRTAPKLERAINAWANERRGERDRTDIFSLLVNNGDETAEPPSKDIIGGLLIFTFGATFETCKNGLIWTLVMLAQHPAIAVSLADEIDHAVGDGLPSMDKVGTLPLLDGVVREALRLFPPVPIQFRRSLVETELGGARIPAGMRAISSVYLINRDPDLYSEPNKFKPERWQDLDRAPYEYPVFGAGGRMCPGAFFGNQMIKTAVAAILSSHRVELAQRTRIDHRTAITLQPHPGVAIVLRDKTTVPRSTLLSGSIRELVDLPN
jgi:cytochrome P450